MTDYYDDDDFDLDGEIIDVEPVDEFDVTEEGSFTDAHYGEVSTTTRPSIHYINESGMPDDVVFRHLRSRGFEKAAISQIEKWSQSLNSPQTTQTLDMFNRSRWQNNDVHVHAVMSRVAWAVENDETLSTLADVVEGLMWQKCRFELIDSDEQDMWNQWAADINLDKMLREMGREEFKLSQFYVGLWWGTRTYSVQEERIDDRIDEFERERKKKEYEEKVEEREAFIAANKGNPEFVAPPELAEPNLEGPGRGNRKRKKKFKVKVPTDYTIFDPTKVLPVGTLMFGRERFAYIATRGEDEAFASVMNGDTADDTVLQLIERKYEPNEMDKTACADLGVDHNRLWLFRKDAVFRHSMTRAQYERYSPVRLKTILPLLEMKQHLRASDRASLIGNTNFIVVITKGSDRLPAKPAEIANLQEQAKVIARLPVLIGDHRLKVEIVSPSTDNTLIDSRHQVLDARLVFAALRTFSPVTQGGNSSGAGVSEMSRVVAQGLESRRHMIMRSIEKNIFRQVLDRNEDVIDEFPNLAFTPKRITLEFNNDIMNGILKLRDRGDISRETTLEELDFDQDTEVLRRGRERVLYDRVFESTTPHSSPTSNPYGAPGQLPPGGNQNVQGNVGPAGQPRTEGGRPPGAQDKKPRATPTPTSRK